MQFFKICNLKKKNAYSLGHHFRFCTKISMNDLVQIHPLSQNWVTNACFVQ